MDSMRDKKETQLTSEFLLPNINYMNCTIQMKNLNLHRTEFDRSSLSKHNVQSQGGYSFPIRVMAEWIISNLETQSNCLLRNILDHSGWARNFLVIVVGGVHGNALLLGWVCLLSRVTVRWGASLLLYIIIPYSGSHAVPDARHQTAQDQKSSKNGPHDGCRYLPCWKLAPLACPHWQKTTLPKQTDVSMIVCNN